MGSELCLGADSWQEERVVWVLKADFGKELGSQGGLDMEREG